MRADTHAPSRRGASNDSYHRGTCADVSRVHLAAAHLREYHIVAARNAGALIRALRTDRARGKHQRKRNDRKRVYLSICHITLIHPSIFLIVISFLIFDFRAAIHASFALSGIAPVM